MVADVVSVIAAGVVTVKTPVSCALQPFLSFTIKVGVPGAMPVKTLFVWVVVVPTPC